MKQTGLKPVIFVGAGPGDPDLVTVKGKKAIETADLILYAGSLVNPELLKWARSDAKIVDSAPLTLDEIVDQIITSYRQGLQVVRIHSGDPSLYGATHEQFQLLEERGVPYTVIPGVTAAFAAAAQLKREFTLPEITQTLIFTRARGRTWVPDSEDLGLLASHKTSMAIYLSIGQIEKVVNELSRHYGLDCPVVVAYRVSWPDQRIITGTLEDIALKVRQEGITKQALILVGKAICPGPDEKRLCSRLYAKGFSHGHRP